MAVQLSVKVRGELVQKRLENFSGEVKKVSYRRLLGRMQAAKNQITKAPDQYDDEPKHHWPEGEKGKRARRWYFAALKDGRVNEPGEYERSGRYENSWKITRTDDGQGYRLRSSFPAAKWLAGTATDPDRQYHVHKTRWQTLRGAVETAVNKLPQDIQGDIVVVARRNGLKHG